MKKRAASTRKNDKDRERLRALIEEATVDCYDEDEQHMGLLTMIEENVACPCRAKVIGEEVTVTDFEPSPRGHGLFAICGRNGKKYPVDVNSLEWVKPYPEGFEWIEAFQAWQGTL